MKPEGDALQDETTLKELHRLLLETQVTEGKLLCGNCGHEYVVKEGIPNFLLPSHLGELHFCSSPACLSLMHSSLIWYDNAMEHSENEMSLLCRIVQFDVPPTKTIVLLAGAYFNYLIDQATVF